MKIKNMSNSKKLIVLSLIILIFGALFYGLCQVLGYDEKFKFYILIGMGISFIFYLGGSIIKLKRDGVLYDERDGQIEKEAGAITSDVFQVILFAIALLTYNLKTVKVSIGGYTILLFFLMWIINGIVSFYIKRRS